MVMHWNEFYDEHEKIKVGQVLPSRYQRDFSTKITLIFSFSLPTFITTFQTTRKRYHFALIAISSKLELTKL